MTVLHGLSQGVEDPRAHADRGDLFDAKLHGDRVGRLESNATDIAREPVGVLGHYPDGVGAIGLKDTNCPGGTDPMTVQEDHDLPHRLLLGPGSGDAAGSYRSDAVYLTQSVWRRLNNVEHLVAESAQQLLGVGRADAPDHAGGQVLLDAIGRGRRRCGRNRDLNWWPWVRSLTHSLDAVMHSPAEIVAALPTTVRQNFLGRRLRLSHRSSHGGELAAALAVRPHLPHGSSGHFV